jgi:membrane-bound serine protease (ClpP class)
VLVTENPRFREIEMTLAQSFYFFLSQPTLIFILLVVGLGGLYLEFTNPGLILPGVVGAIALLLAMIGFSIVPINYTGAALLALGAILLAAEVFVPSFGALGVGGMVCLVVGSLLLFETREAPGVVVDRTWIAATAVVFGAVFLGVSLLVVRSFGRPVETGVEGMIGRVAVARERLAPRGSVRMSGEIWDAAVTGDEAVESGEEVVVVAVEGLRLVVEPRRRT